MMILIKEAKRLIRNQGLALRVPSLSINHMAKCGCCYDLYDAKTGSGVILEGGRVCSVPSNHGFVYQPSISLVKNGEAIQMFKLFIGAK